jgi:hypothetical protein
VRLFKEREREHMALVFVTFCQNKRSQTMNEFYNFTPKYFKAILYVGVSSSRASKHSRSGAQIYRQNE